MNASRAVGPTVFSLLALAFWAATAPPAAALIEVFEGNDPVEDRHGWPAGSLDVANLDNRLGYWVGPPFGGGEHHFEYKGDTDAFQRTLELSAKIESREPVRLVVHEGPAESVFLTDGKKPDAKRARYDWAFTVWNPKVYAQLYNDPKTFITADHPGGNFRRPLVPPVIDVYVGGAPAGQGVDWSRVKVPGNVKVTDERASANGYPASAGSVLRGRVTDLATSKPLAGARVVLESSGGNESKAGDVPSATTAADGGFELKNVPAGGFRVQCSSEGYAPRVLAYAQFGKDTLKEFPSASLARAVTLTGKVVNGADKKGLAGVRVLTHSVVSADGGGYVLPANAEATTDAEGRFTLPGLPAGSCHLLTRNTTFQRLDPLKRQPVPAEDAALRMTATGNVQGKLTQRGGAPTDGPYLAEITPEGGNKIGSWGGSMNVAADGTFKFENVPPGKYTVTARLNPGPVLKGKDPNAKEVVIEPGKTLEVEIAVK